MAPGRDSSSLIHSSEVVLDAVLVPDGLEFADAGGTFENVDDVTRWALNAREGDQAAFSAFVRSTQNDVWRLCRHLSDGQSADDLTQETYVRAVKAIGKYRGEAPARLWLLGIARRVCADAVRASQRRRRLELRLMNRAKTTGTDVCGDGTSATELALLLRAVSEDRAYAFFCTQVLGLSYAETATLANCPVGTVRSRVARARADLMGMLDDQTGQGTQNAAGD